MRGKKLKEFCKTCEHSDFGVCQFFNMPLIQIVKCTKYDKLQR